MTAHSQMLTEGVPGPSLLRTDFPALYQSASAASRQGQRLYRRLVVVNLGLLVMVAVLSATTFLLPNKNESIAQVFASSIVVLLLSAMAANFINWRRGDDKNWFDGRAVAESVKTTSWRYMMRSVPFNEDATCDHQFARMLKAILDERKDLRQELGALSVDSRQITQRMRDARRLGIRKRRDFYIQERLNGQISWYRRQAHLNGQLAERWFWASFGSEFVGLIIAVSAFVFTLNALDLVGVAAALAVAFTAWTELGRHKELNKRYGIAWQELLGIKDLATSVKTEIGLQDLVRTAEDAISREHTMWIAKHG